MNCPHCGYENNETAKFCRNCGKPLNKPAYIECPNCHALNNKENSFCDVCGSPLGNHAAPQTPQKVSAKNKIGIIAAIIAAAVVAGVGGYYVFHHFTSDNEPIASESENNLSSEKTETGQYISLSKQDSYKEPFSDEKSSAIKENEMVSVVDITTRAGSDEIYGKLADGRYILLEDDDHHYFEQADWTKSSKYDLDRTYSLLADLEEMDKDGSPLGNFIDRGEDIQFKKFEENQTGIIRGQLENENYVIVSDEDGYYIKGLESQNSDEAKTDSNYIGAKNEYPGHIREKSTYGGPAAIQNILENYGIKKSQSEIASGMTEGSVFDYRDITNSLNAFQKNSWNSMYFDVSELDGMMCDQFKEYLESDLKAGKPVIVVIDRNYLGEDASKSNYAIVWGLNKDTGKFIVYSPTEGQGKFLLELHELEDAMKASGVFCYIY